MTSLYVFGVHVFKLVLAVLETGRLRYSRDSFNQLDGFGSHFVLRVTMGSSSSIFGTLPGICS